MYSVIAGSSNSAVSVWAMTAGRNAQAGFDSGYARCGLRYWKSCARSSCSLLLEVQVRDPPAFRSVPVRQHTLHECMLCIALYSSLHCTILNLACLHAHYTFPDPWLLLKTKCPFGPVPSATVQGTASEYLHLARER